MHFLNFATTFACFSRLSRPQNSSFSSRVDNSNHKGLVNQLDTLSPGSEIPSFVSTPSLQPSPHAPIPPLLKLHGTLTVDDGHYLKVVYAVDRIGFEDYGGLQTRHPALMRLISDAFASVNGSEILSQRLGPAGTQCISVFSWDWERSSSPVRAFLTDII